MSIKSVTSLFCICLIVFSSCVPMAFAENEISPDADNINTSNQNTDVGELSSKEQQLLDFSQDLSLSDPMYLNPDENTLEIFDETELNKVASSSLSPSFSYDNIGNLVSAPELNSFDEKYSTSLSSGAATYNYELQVPEGVAGFQPILFLSYNSHAAGGTYGWLGDSWSLNENYILRKVNYTPTNVNDDTYQLVFNGASYDLIYNRTTGLYNTEVESYLNIKKEAGGNNNRNEYWTVKSNDGTVFRFGYNTDSELVNPVSGRNYVSKWYMDQAQDLNGNLIHYNYVENPTSGEISATYLNSIIYNNGAAEISFSRTPKPTVFNIYREGGQYKELNLLSSISMSVNSELIRRYELDYDTSQNHVILNSIELFGNDNSSSLPPTVFTYSGRSESFYSPDFLIIQYPLRVHGESTGAVFADLAGDGLPDIILSGTPYDRTGLWTNYVFEHSAVLHFPDIRRIPAYITEDGMDTGLRFVDLNGDGYNDIVQNSRVRSSTYNRSWINDGNGFFTLNNNWRIPTQITNNSSNRGVNFVDVNGDGLVDIVQNTVTPNSNNTWINTGTGFSANSSWRIPVATLNNGKDQGVRFVDINGDGLIDIVQNSINPSYNRTWINNGSGFVLDSNWNTPVAFMNNYVDQGVRFMDVNGDGLTDIVQRSKNPNLSGTWINTGSGFILDNSISFPAGFSFTDAGEDLGFVIIDMNGDGLLDLISETGGGGPDADSYFKSASVSGHSVPPYRLTQINHSSGAKTKIEYDFSAKFNNSDENGKEKMSSKMWVVSSITAIPGNSQQNIVTDYSYSGGVYHTEPRGKSEFRGFGKVIVSGTNQATTEHYFHQEKGKVGLEYRTVITSDSLLHKDVIFDYHSTVSNGVYVVNLNGTQEKLYNNDGTFITVQTNYTYDSYGNILTTLQSGDLSISGDERKIVTEYVYNTNKWILTTIKSVTMYDSSNQQIAKSSFYYDGSNSLSASPSRGLVTKIISWNNQGPDEELRFEYDSFGNLIKEIDGNGFSTRINYVSPNISVFPISITNAKEQTTLLNYDSASGNLLSVTDPNGFVTMYTYDVFGRIQKIIHPYDSVNSPSIEYTYYQNVFPQYIKISVKDDDQTLDTYEYFDGFGNIVKIEAVGNSNRRYIQELEYNQHGATKIIAPYTGNEMKLITTYKYNELGNLIEVINPNSTSRRVVYDGLTVIKYDENNNKISYIYDIYQNIQKVIEYNGDEIYETGYVYDSLDNLIKIIPHQNYDQLNVTFVEAGSEFVFPDYFLLDSRTAAVQFSELKPGEEIILNVSVGSGSGTRPQNPNIFSFYDNFNTATGWRNTNYNPLTMPSHRGFIDYNASKYIDGTGLSYNYSGPAEGAEYWYISNEKDIIHDGYVFYTRMENELSQGAYGNSQGYHFSHFGMGNQSSIMTGNAIGSNGNQFIAKYFPSYLAFVLEGVASVPWLTVITSTHNDEPTSALSTALPTYSMSLFKIEYNPELENAIFYVDGSRRSSVSGLEPSNSSPVSMFFGAQNARNRIDYIIGYKSFQDISKRQSDSNGEIELAIRNTGSETITDAIVEFNISNLNLQNNSLSSKNLVFTKSSNAVISSIPYSSAYNVANTTFTYNSLGQKIQLDDPDLGIWKFEYDSNGNVIKQTDNKSIITKYEYDALNRVTKIDYPTDSDIIYEYDNGTIGMLSQVTSEIMTKSYSYDQRLRVVEEKITTEADKYIRGDYNLKYDSSELPELPDPGLPLPDPVTGTFYNENSININLHQNEFFVEELKLTDFRVAMFASDVAYLHLNGKEILKFKDHGGGGDLYVYNANGVLLTILSPVNGNPDYESITFDITFKSDGNDVRLEIEPNSRWYPQYFASSFELGSPISSVNMNLISSWGDYTYLSGSYEASYGQYNQETSQPPISDPSIHVPLIYSFSGEDDIDIQFGKNGFYVNQLKLENLRVSMYVGDVAYLYLNDNRILKFEDHAGGGDLSIYDADDNLLGKVSPVNGNRGYENITFDVIFTSDGSNTYLEIEGDRMYVYPRHSAYSFDMDSISSMNLYLYNSRWPGSSYIDVECEITYEHISSEIEYEEWPLVEYTEEITDSFRVSDQHTISLNSGGFSAQEVTLKNLRTILSQNETASVYFDNLEVLRFESSQNGTLSIFDENGILDVITDANGDSELQNMTFDISFVFDDSESFIQLMKYSEGILIDTHLYSGIFSSTIQEMKIVYDPDGDGLVDYITTYEYDSMNRVTSITHPNGQTSTYTYGDRGMMESIFGIIDNIEYNSMNLITKKEYSNGVTTNLGYYETTKQLKEIKSNNSYSQYLQDFEYKFDNVGNVIGILDRYDSIQQDFVYDDLNRLVMAGGDDYYQYYAYNPIGSMLAVYDGLEVTRIEYGVNAGIHAPTKINDTSLIYDLNGNLIEDDRFIYIYDEANFMRSVESKESGKTVAEYWYDENGQRIKKLESGKATYYISDAYSVEDGKSSVYYFANGERIAKRTSDSVEWYLNDYLGSTNVAVNENGELSEKISYYPFGSYRSVSGGTNNLAPVMMTNLFEEPSFIVEKEYDSMSLSKYVKEYGMFRLDSKKVEQKLEEAGYESKDLISHLTERNNLNSVESLKSSSHNQSVQIVDLSEFDEAAEFDFIAYPAHRSQSSESINIPEEFSDVSGNSDEAKNLSNESLNEFSETQMQKIKSDDLDIDESKISSLNDALSLKEFDNSESSELDLIELDNLLQNIELLNPIELQSRIEAVKRTVNNSSIEREVLDINSQRIEASATPEILVPSGFKTRELASNQSVNAYNKQNLIHGHTYYISSKMVGNGVDAFTEQFNSSSVMKATSNAQNTHNLHELNSVSGIFTHYAGDKQEIENILAANMNSDVFSVNEPILIDLTATFGKGNEPDVEWCHENIPHFEGTQTINVQSTTSPSGQQIFASSKYTYTGKEFDTDIGLYYYGARYYNPTTFSFTQADSVIPNVYNPQSLNRYAYSYNNPVTYNDPDGHTPLLVTAAAGAVAGGLIAGVASAAVQYATTGEIDMKQVAGATVGGAVAGGIFGLTMGFGSSLMAGWGLTATQSTIVLGITGSFVNLGSGIAGRTAESLVVNDGKIDKEYIFNDESMLMDLGFGAAGNIGKPVKSIPFKEAWKKGGVIKDTVKKIATNSFNESVYQSINYHNEISNIYNVVSEHRKDPSHGGGAQYCICGAPL